MSSFEASAFVLVLIASLMFFIVARRQVDFLTVAIIGAAFYFLPLLTGHVTPLGKLDTTIPPGVYLIATGYLVSLLVGATISDRVLPPQQYESKNGKPLSVWYFSIAMVGLVSELVRTKGALVDPDKVAALSQVSLLYATCEVGASLACISAVDERRWAIVAGACLLLAFDLLIGFRVFALLTALSIGMSLLAQQGRIRLITKSLVYGTAALTLVLAMLFVHTVRTAIFDQFAINVEHSQRSFRSDSLQYIQQTAKVQDQIDQAVISYIPVNREIVRFALIPIKILVQSEPFTVQATLAETIRQSYTCSAYNFLKIVRIAIPPGLGRIIETDFPETFYDEYQPVLFPNVGYGLGANVWAEMLCRFGYLGIPAICIVVVSALILSYRWFCRAPASLKAPIAFAGVIVGFYFHRNDVQYTMVLIKQVAYVFFAAYIASWIWGAVNSRANLFLFR